MNKINIHKTIDRAAFANIKVVAVWMQLNPHQELVGEGIGTHLARLIKGMERMDNIKVIMCAPSWSREIIDNYLWMYDLKHLVRVEYFGPKLGIFMGGLKGKRDSGGKKSRSLESVVSYALNRTASFLPGTIVSVFGILLMPVLMPYLWVKRFASTIWHKLRNIALQYREAVVAKLSSGVADAMAFYIDNSKQIDACIVPIGNWNKCTKIKNKPITVQIPDIVYLEFPEVFDPGGGIEQATSALIKVANHATRVVSPSAYIKDIHHEKLGVLARKSKVVLHAPMLLNAELPVKSDAGIAEIKAVGYRVAEEFLQDTLLGANFGGYLPEKTNLKKVGAGLRGRLRRNNVLVQSDLRLRQFGDSLYWLTALSDAWGKQDYTLYFPTQNRPYKNILRLVRSIGQLKDNYGLNIVLLLTGDIGLSPQIQEEIKARDLCANVLFLPRLSARLHAAMYARADLTVAASLFEGGFPFLFSESLSVGTPVVMADIPVTRLVLDKSLWSSTLFNPRSIDDMVRSIHYGLTQRDELFALQRPVFDRQARERSWENVAAEYLLACEEGIEELRLSKEKNDQGLSGNLLNSDSETDVDTDDHFDRLRR